MCSVCYIGTLWRRTCVRLGGWISRGYSVCECWFSVYGYLPTGGGSLDGDVGVVDLVAGLSFSCELQVEVYSVEVI